MTLYSLGNQSFVFYKFGVHVLKSSFHLPFSRPSFRFYIP